MAATGPDVGGSKGCRIKKFWEAKVRRGDGDEMRQIEEGERSDLLGSHMHLHQ